MKGPGKSSAERRTIELKNTITQTSHELPEKKRRKSRLRSNHHLMEPEELTPEERWDRIVELLAVMSMPDTSRPVLNDDNGAQL